MFGLDLKDTRVEQSLLACIILVLHYCFTAQCLKLAFESGKFLNYTPHHSSASGPCFQTGESGSPAGVQLSSRPTS